MDPADRSRPASFQACTTLLTVSGVVPRRLAASFQLRGKVTCAAFCLPSLFRADLAIHDRQNVPSDPLLHVTSADKNSPLPQLIRHRQAIEKRLSFEGRILGQELLEEWPIAPAKENLCRCFYGVVRCGRQRISEKVKFEQQPNDPGIAGFVDRP